MLERPLPEERVHIDYDRLKPLTRVIQLTSIVVAEASLRSVIDPRQSAELVGQKGYALSLGDARWWLDRTSLDVVLGYRVATGVDRGGERVELFTIGARFVVNYALPEGTKVPTEGRDSLMADLVAANGQVNVFPYLRQLVVDLTSRAGWPPLVLNVFKAPASRPRDLVRMARPWEPSTP